MTPKQINSVVDSILCDYRQGRDIDAAEPANRPDKDAIIDATKKLLCIVYPSYSQDPSLDTAGLIRDVLHTFSQQIALVQPGEAEEKAVAFMEKIPAIRALAQTDVEAAYDGDPAATGCDEIIFCYPGLFAITVQRLAHELYLMKIRDY